VKASGKPVFDTNGEFRGYRGTGTDFARAGIAYLKRNCSADYHASHFRFHLA
jgi:hypothetical protein